MNKNHKVVCHNELNEDYTMKDAIKDLNDAIKRGEETKNGHPECTYVHTFKTVHSVNCR